MLTAWRTLPAPAIPRPTPWSCSVSPFQTPKPRSSRAGADTLPPGFFPGKGQSCSSLSPSSPCSQLAIWHCQEDLCLEPRCSQAQTRADASLRLNNNLISQGSAGQKEESKGRYSANSRVCFSGARTSPVLGCWEGAAEQLEQPKVWCGPLFPSNLAGSLPCYPKSQLHSLQQSCLVFRPQAAWTWELPRLRLSRGFLHL